MEKVMEKIVKEVNKAYEGLAEYAEKLDNILEIIETFNDENEEVSVAQDWFEHKNFEQYEDYGDAKGYFDTVTENFYIVFEEYGQKGSTLIQEISKDSEEYAENYRKYREWKRTQYGWHKNIDNDLVYVSENGNEYWILALSGWKAKIIYDCLGIFLTKRQEDASLFIDKMIGYVFGEDDEREIKKYIEKTVKKYEKENIK